MNHISPLFSEFSTFGFSGSRSVVPPHLADFINSVPRGGLICVGDAKGVDAAVQSIAATGPGTVKVFRVSSYPASSYTGSLALRSAACVREVSEKQGLWVAFPSEKCPSSLRPSASVSQCFCGTRSGTWASLAFAVGSACDCLLVLPPSVEPPMWVKNRFQSVSENIWLYRPFS